MGIKNGVNIPEYQGVFYDSEGDILFDCKVFGIDYGKPTDVILTNMRNNTTYGPIRVTSHSMNISDLVVEAIQEVLQRD